MKAYQELSEKELLSLKSELEKAYEQEKAKGLKLDMSRGKPAISQLDMARDFMDTLDSGSDMKAENGVDVRRYDGGSGGKCDCVRQRKPGNYV